MQRIAFMRWNGARIGDNSQERIRLISIFLIFVCELIYIFFLGCWNTIKKAIRAVQKLIPKLCQSVTMGKSITVNHILSVNLVCYAFLGKSHLSEQFWSSSSFKCCVLINTLLLASLENRATVYLLQIAVSRQLHIKDTSHLPKLYSWKSLCPQTGLCIYVSLLDNINSCGLRAWGNSSKFSVSAPNGIMTAQLETALRALPCGAVLPGPHVPSEAEPWKLGCCQPPPPLAWRLIHVGDKPRERLVGYSHIWQEARIQAVQEKTGIWCLELTPWRTDVLLKNSMIPLG